jgi:hypothetical protein
MVMSAKVFLQMFPCLHAMKSLVALAGLISLVLLLSACQTALSPGQVTLAFWEAMAQGNIESARKHATKDTQYLVIKQQNMEGASINTGEVVIDGPNASVLTIMTLKKTVGKEPFSFNTVLLKENDLWKVDYQQTLNNISVMPFGELFKSLRAIGDAINKELEQQIPLLDKQIKSFGEELIRQMEEFRRDLENSIPPDKQTPQPGSI